MQDFLFKVIKRNNSLGFQRRNGIGMIITTFARSTFWMSWKRNRNCPSPLASFLEHLITNNTPYCFYGTNHESAIALLSGRVSIYRRNDKTGLQQWERILFKKQYEGCIKLGEQRYNKASHLGFAGKLACVLEQQNSQTSFDWPGTGLDIWEEIVASFRSGKESWDFNGVWLDGRSTVNSRKNTII